MIARIGTLLILLGSMAMPDATVFAGQDPYDQLMSEAQTRTVQQFEQSVWDVQSRSRAVVRKPTLAALIGSVSAASTLEITVNMPPQSIAVQGTDVRSPKLNLGNCQANLPNCPNCEAWNLACHPVRAACEVGKAAAQATCMATNLVLGGLSEKKLAEVEFPGAHVEGELKLSSIQVAVSDNLDAATVSGNVAGHAFASTRISLKPEPLVTLSGCWKTDMTLTRTGIEPAESTLAVTAALQMIKSSDGLRFSYRIPELKPKIRVEENAFLKLLRENVHVLFLCPDILVPATFDLLSPNKTLFTQEHEVKIDESTGQTDVLKFAFDLPNAKRQITVVEGARWLGIEVLEPQF